MEVFKLHFHNVLAAVGLKRGVMVMDKAGGFVFDASVRRVGNMRQILRAVGFGGGKGGEEAQSNQAGMYSRLEGMRELEMWRREQP